VASGPDVSANTLCMRTGGAARLATLAATQPPSVVAAVQDRVAQSGVVGEAGLGQDRGVRELGADQALPLQRGPHRRVGQPARVLGEGDRLRADMEMVAVRVRQVGDDNAAAALFRRRHRMVRRARQLLKDRQRLQLERVEVQRVLLRRHGGVGTCGVRGTGRVVRPTIAHAAGAGRASRAAPCRAVAGHRAKGRADGAARR